MIVRRTPNEHRAIDVIDHAKWGYFGKSALAYQMAVEIRAEASSLLPEDDPNHAKLVERLAEFEAAMNDSKPDDNP